MLQRINEGQGGLALGQVISQVLAEAVLVSLIVQRIIDELEGRPDVIAICLLYTSRCV